MINNKHQLNDVSINNLYYQKKTIDAFVYTKASLVCLQISIKFSEIIPKFETYISLSMATLAFLTADDFSVYVLRY